MAIRKGKPYVVMGWFKDKGVGVAHVGLYTGAAGWLITPLSVPRSLDYQPNTFDGTDICGAYRKSQLPLPAGYITTSVFVVDIERLAIVPGYMTGTLTAMSITEMLDHFPIAPGAKIEKTWPPTKPPVSDKQFENAQLMHRTLRVMAAADEKPNDPFSQLDVPHSRDIKDILSPVDTSRLVMQVNTAMANRHNYHIDHDTGYIEVMVQLKGRVSTDDTQTLTHLLRERGWGLIIEYNTDDRGQSYTKLLIYGKKE